MEIEEPIPKKKKKNKKDKKEQIDETAQTLGETIEIFDEPGKKKKKKSKNTELVDSEIIVIDDNSNSRDDHDTNKSKILDELFTKKKKSKKCEMTLGSEEYQFNAGDTNAVNEEKEIPTKKKKKSKQDKMNNCDSEETIQTETLAADSPVSAEKSSKKKKKSKTPAEPLHEDATLEPNPPASDAIEEPSLMRKTDVSAASRSFGDNSDQSVDEDQPEDLLSMEEIKDRLKEFNTYIISQFCAEKFQMFDMKEFRDSTLSEILGYGTSENVELKVVESRADEKRIIDLWHNRKAERYKKTANTMNIKYPKTVKRTTIRAVKKRVAFQGI